MKFAILLIISIVIFPNIIQSQSLSELKNRDDFAFYLSSVVYDASSLYHVKNFLLSDVVSVFDDIPELQDANYTPLVKGTANIKCKENTIGNIDVFWNDTLIVEVANPFICGERILLREFWSERPDLLHVFPFFEVFAFDQKNRKVNVDSLARNGFYKMLNDINYNNQENIELEVDRSMFMKQRLHRHIAYYNYSNKSFGLLCCNAEIKSDDECLIRKICHDFCAQNGCCRISFELFTWHRKAISEFHEVLLSHFPYLNLPLIVVDSRVESQKTIKQVPNLESELLRHYFTCFVDIDSEQIKPIGFTRFADYFVTIVKRKIQKDIAIQTFDDLGNSISCIFLKEETHENNFLIKDDGHIILMKEIDSKHFYTISPNGVISLFVRD